MRHIGHLVETFRASSRHYIDRLFENLEAISLDLRLDYRLNRRLILIILFVVFCVLGLLHAIRSDFGESTTAWLTSSRGKELLEVMKAIVTPVAILFGAIWTYYLFVRRRTFGYRVDIHIDLWTTIVTEDAIYVIIRFIFHNVGNIRIVPRTMNAKVSNHDGHEFVHLEDNPNLLSDYIRDFHRNGTDVFSLEPKTALKADWLLRLPSTTKTERLPLLNVEVAVSDRYDHEWLEKTVVQFDQTEKGERYEPGIITS